MAGINRADGQQSILIVFDRRGGDFQKRMARAIETSGLYVDHDRQKTAETVIEGVFRGRDGHTPMIPVFP